MITDQLNFFDIILKDEIQKKKSLIIQYFEEFDLNKFHSFQDNSNSSGNSSDWWYSRWYEFFSFQKKWTIDIQKRLDLFYEIWFKYNHSFQRNNLNIS